MCSFTNFTCKVNKQCVTSKLYNINSVIIKQIFVLLCISLFSFNLCNNNSAVSLETNKIFGLTNVAINTSQVKVVKNIKHKSFIVPCENDLQNQNRSCKTGNITINLFSQKNDSLNNNSTLSISPVLKENHHNITMYYSAPKRRKRKRKGKQRKRNRISNLNEEYRYTFGKGLQITLDMKRNIVNVNLDEDNLREVLNGFPYEETDEEGRRKHGDKNYDMISKVLPLFILPFLIQSAIIPFIVTKLKLLLLKSILIGKLAILLIIISAIKNSQQMVPHEPPPSYFAWKSEHKPEILPGYKFEENPYTWSTR